MFSLQYSSLVTFIAITSLLGASASPMVLESRQGPQPVTVTYEITSIENGEGKYFNIGASGKAGSQLSHAESYEVGYTIELGANLGLSIKEIFELGVSAAISKSTSKGSEDGIQVECPAPGDWTCSMVIKPKVVIKHGNQNFQGVRSPYTVSFPRVTKENILFFEADICACPNKVGWASPGAPEKCPEDC
ncbi:hypothetical protein BGZ60DRAFT_243359 [Tricladium varicosporioides]|nr:hypothetical protein BGZ60DRAFT_243359 [Hymenoscyphus varicosporioides]